MYWKAYADMKTSTKVAPDTPSSCAICCVLVRADGMWGTQEEEGDEHKNGGWVVCDNCHSQYAGDPLGGQNAAQFRWDTHGPCKVLEGV